MSQEYAPCHVCGEPTSEHSNAVCNLCSRPFHLALRNDIPAKDCGQVWINEEFLALEFACNTCLAVPPAGDAAAAPVPAPRRRYTRRQGVSASALVRDKQRRARW